jgi:hypothetical protein
MTKDKIKQLININKEFNGQITLKYVHESSIYSTEEMSCLYYGHVNKMIIDNYYTNDSVRIEITTESINGIVDIIYEHLSNNVYQYILQTIKNLNLADEDLKYFDTTHNLFVKFQQEVIRLKSIELQSQFC